MKDQYISNVKDINKRSYIRFIDVKNNTQHHKNYDLLHADIVQNKITSFTCSTAFLYLSDALNNMMKFSSNSSCKLQLSCI